MDLSEVGNYMNRISELLYEIRVLSKNEIPDFRYAPYNSDIELLEYILNEYKDRLKR